MTRNAILRRVAGHLALLAIMLFAVAPLLLATHPHTNHDPVVSHCSVCVLATVAAIAANDIGTLGPTHSELAPVMDHGPALLADDIAHNDDSRAPPAAWPTY